MLLDVSMEVWYPTLRLGDYVPVLGRLCRVEQIGDAGPPNARRQGWMTMVVADPPPGVTFQKGSIGIPLHDSVGAVQFEFGKVIAVARATAEAAAGDGARGPVADVKITATNLLPPSLPAPDPS